MAEIDDSTLNAVDSTEILNGDPTEKLNGVTIDDEEHSSQSKPNSNEDQITLYEVFNNVSNHILFPRKDSEHELNTSLIHRIKTTASQNWPLLPEAARNTGRRVLLWTCQGTALRSLLVVSVGTVTFLALTGCLVFMLFFLVATMNAIVISLLLSVAAAGVFLALFFTCVAAVYVGALFIAAFVISTATISTIIVILFVAGWVAFVYSMWLLIKKSVDLASHSLNIGSAIPAASSAWNGQTYHELHEVSD
ncbi:KANADI like transcription factor [Heracleum sosnowskyi]|uniref:KANADI like transcription factor n=1 Tax=Heracleum sosnowskyi TaxID=360622 RepID=A0AAD8HQ56_9APIA|nr:KANADI like transcription factor [Heracleum sosnowskyi]